MVIFNSLKRSLEVLHILKLFFIIENLFDVKGVINGKHIVKETWVNAINGDGNGRLLTQWPPEKEYSFYFLF